MKINVLIFIWNLVMRYNMFDVCFTSSNNTSILIISITIKVGGKVTPRDVNHKSLFAAFKLQQKQMNACLSLPR